MVVRSVNVEEQGLLRRISFPTASIGHADLLGIVKNASSHVADFSFDCKERNHPAFGKNFQLYGTTVNEIVSQLRARGILGSRQLLPDFYLNILDVNWVEEVVVITLKLRSISDNKLVEYQLKLTVQRTVNEFLEALAR